MYYNINEDPEERKKKHLLFFPKFMPIQDWVLCRKVYTGSSTLKSWGLYS